MFILKLISNKLHKSGASNQHKSHFHIQLSRAMGLLGKDLLTELPSYFRPSIVSNTSEIFAYD